jgi:hypothetical protein
LKNGVPNTNEWAVLRGRCMSMEPTAPLSDDLIVKLPAVRPGQNPPVITTAAWLSPTRRDTLARARDDLEQ